MKSAKMYIAIAVLALGTTGVFAFKTLEKHPTATITTLYDINGNTIATAPTGNSHWTNNQVAGSNTAQIVTSSTTVDLYGATDGVTRAYYKP
jgi:hypothetical protein